MRNSEGSILNNFPFLLQVEFGNSSFKNNHLNQDLVFQVAATKAEKNKF